MILDTTTRSVEVLLSAAPVANQLVVISSWTDMASGTTTSGCTPVSTNSTTAVTAVAAPASGKQRNVYAISVFNADTGTATVKIQLDDSGTKYKMVEVPLLPGETLSYSDVDSWRVLSATGLIKASNTTVFSVATTIAGQVAKSASFTFALNEAGCLAVCTSSSAINATLPANSGVAFPMGTFLFVMQGGSGVVTIQGASGVTVRIGATAATDGSYRFRAAIKIGTDEWVVF